jgi:AraC-like DNA-binding protein
MSKRTLQRRLAGAGTSLAALSQEVRRFLALEYLADRSLSITEVSFLLGFSSLSAFDRAFKTWTGRTPAEYRRSARSSK